MYSATVLEDTTNSFDILGWNWPRNSLPDILHSKPAIAKKLNQIGMHGETSCFLNIQHDYFCDLKFWLMYFSTIISAFMQKIVKKGGMLF